MYIYKKSFIEAHSLAGGIKFKSREKGNTDCQELRRKDDKHWHFKKDRIKLTLDIEKKYLRKAFRGHQDI